MSEIQSFIKALRPFSFVVSISAVLLSIVFAYLQGIYRVDLSLIVLLLALVLQSAVNLLNNYSDILIETNPIEIERIHFHFNIAVFLLILTMIFGLWLVSLRGSSLFLLGIVGLVGAWGYTGNPINYKQRGMGVFLVFFLMGVMLTGGSYYIITGLYSIEVFLISIPFSLLASLLLLSNEIRDYEADKNKNINTLTVRIGLSKSVKLFKALVFLLFLSVPLLFKYFHYPYLWVCLLSLFFLVKPWQMLHVDALQRSQITALMGRFYAIYSFLFILGLILSTP